MTYEKLVALHVQTWLWRRDKLHISRSTVSSNRNTSSSNLQFDQQQMWTETNIFNAIHGSQPCHYYSIVWLTTRTMSNYM